MGRMANFVGDISIPVPAQQFIQGGRLRRHLIPLLADVCPPHRCRAWYSTIRTPHRGEALMRLIEERKDQPV
jgi:hypothetical protein